MIASYLLSVLFTLSFCFYSKYQFADERGQSAVRGKWHPWGALMRACLVGICIAAYGVPDGFLIGAIMLPMFDIGINVIALNQPPLYVGKTAGWDRKIGMWKWVIYMLLLLVAIYFKILL